MKQATFALCLLLLWACDDGGGGATTTDAAMAGAMALADVGAAAPDMAVPEPWAACPTTRWSPEDLAAAIRTFLEAD